MKKKLLIGLLPLVFFSCNNKPGKNAPKGSVNIDSLQKICENQDKEIKELKETIGKLSFPADKRLEQIKRLISEGDYDSAFNSMVELIRLFPNSAEASECDRLNKSIEEKKEAAKAEAERIKALGFKAINTKTNFTIDYNTVTLSNISVGKTFVFDSYGSEYFYRDADRNTKYVSAAMSVKSTDTDPNLPQIALYKINGDKMELFDKFCVEFARWEDYGTYLGNYHDSHNDFAKVNTVKFKVGLQVPDRILSAPYALVVKKENCLSRSYNKYDNPPVKYQGNASYPQTLSVDDFKEQYILVQIKNIK